MELCLSIPARWGPPIGTVRVLESPGSGDSIAQKLAAAHPNVTSVLLRGAGAAAVARLSWAPDSVPALVFDDEDDSPLAALFQPPPLPLDGCAWQSAQLTTPAQVAAVLYVQQVTQAIQVLADIMALDATEVISLGEEDEGCRKRRRLEEDAWMTAAPEWSSDADDLPPSPLGPENWWAELDFEDILPRSPATAVSCKVADLEAVEVVAAVAAVAATPPPLAILPVYLSPSAYRRPERSAVVCSVCSCAVI